MRRLVLVAACLVLLPAGLAQANDHTLRRCRRHHSHHYCRHHGFHHTRVRWEHGVASWYVDGGQTASGWHARYGVANLTYPMGTEVEICYHGCVVATVDDRGPYVAGREWDLGASTAQAVGFSGVATVRWRLVRRG